MLRASYFLIMVTAANLVIAPVVYGDSFRCGRKLVRTGDTSGELLRVCGEPYHKDRGKEEITVDGIRRSMSVERWHYKKSSRKLEHIIIIYKGYVTKVIVGGR